MLGVPLTVTRNRTSIEASWSYFEPNEPEITENYIFGTYRVGVGFIWVW